MFKSYFPIEYYPYNNPVGIYYSHPLSLKDNTFTKTKNKSYHTTNHNKTSKEVTLYLNILFGSAKKIGKDNNVNSEKWNKIECNAPQDSKSFTIDATKFRLLYYSITLFNPVDNPNIRIINKNMGDKKNNENALSSGYLLKAP